MKKRTTGRLYKGVPISFDDTQIEYINDTVERLRPRVANRSHYFQILLEMDQACNLVEQGLAVVQARMFAKGR